MNLQVALPWLNEIVSDPKEIQKLIDRHALEDWYANYSQNKIDRKNGSIDHFPLKEKQRVRELLRKLTSFEQAVVYLRFWENLLAYEIARLFGLSEERILSILEESIKKLRSLYDLELSRSQISQDNLLEGTSRS
ncbi:MAG: Sigma-70, region 4 [Bacteriovoracaceae bacterium]|nr:Sigma-70, region 4 [Bacteriovoracaceae bacterium]